jgi:hypothetical protein
MTGEYVTKFRNLKVGQVFTVIDGLGPRQRDVMLLRACVKTGSRTYRRTGEAQQWKLSWSAKVQAHPK